MDSHTGGVWEYTVNTERISTPDSNKETPWQRNDLNTK
jgi:hypothetical protein